MFVITWTSLLKKTTSGFLCDNLQKNYEQLVKWQKIFWQNVLHNLKKLVTTCFMNLLVLFFLEVWLANRKKSSKLCCHSKPTTSIWTPIKDRHFIFVHIDLRNVYQILYMWKLCFKKFYVSLHGFCHLHPHPNYNGRLNLKICQNFVRTKFFLRFVGG